MTNLQLPGDVRTAFSHLAMIGLAALLEDAAVDGVRVGWTTGLDPSPVVSAPELDWRRASETVRQHAARHAAPTDWTAATLDGGEVGLMSPRIRPRPNPLAWHDLAAARRRAIDDLAASSSWLDLRLIGALGEPAYWRFNPQGQAVPDDGASRWEMKTRNRGEDLVRNRLHPLAAHVSVRDLDGIEAGLRGTSVIDEAGNDAVDSRTATGLVAPGPTDNALAWCALWGISQFPVAQRMGRRSQTAGHAEPTRRSGPRRHGWFYLPMPSDPMPLPRFRTIVGSEQLAVAARSDPEGLAADAARAWLVDRTVGAIVRFPIGEFGSASAPERRALLGTVIPLSDPP